MGLAAAARDRALRLARGARGRAAGGRAARPERDGRLLRQRRVPRLVSRGAQLSPGLRAARSGAPRFAGFVFWDDVHPTSATHSAVGAALVAEVEAKLHL